MSTNRYEVCFGNTNTCQCPDHTYWNGSVCALQLFENETGEQLNSCRPDFNLSSLTDCYRPFPKCAQTPFNGK